MPSNVDPAAIELVDTDAIDITALLVVIEEEGDA